MSIVFKRWRKIIEIEEGIIWICHFHSKNRRIYLPFYESIIQKIRNFWKSHSYNSTNFRWKWNLYFLINPKDFRFSWDTGLNQSDKICSSISWNVVLKVIFSSFLFRINFKSGRILKIKSTMHWEPHQFCCCINLKIKVLRRSAYPHLDKIYILMTIAHS